MKIHTNRSKILDIIVDDGPLAIVLARHDGTIAYCNDKFSFMLGYENSELIDMCFQDITHEDDLFIDIDLYASLNNREIDNYSLEKRYIHKDGQTIWTKLTISVCGNVGADQYSVMMIYDITEQKEKISSVIDEIQDKLERLDRSNKEGSSDGMDI